ncbi:hypothetical protein ACEN9F_13945 [Duganella sp. CT11-25]|uniref:hypothetical protein n=1 Tax=unclassified Duganella TaxID=2636909 RepID=UPI0039AF894A
MSFISYAPNFEDVLLWRALRHIGHGYYIDLQPNAAPVGSVTHAFYQRGWRGLNLAASPALARALRVARPADATLDGAAGPRAGSAMLYEIPDLHTATRDAEQAQQQRAAGRDVLQREIAVHALDQLCAQHAAPAIHLLHAGADAAEALAGLDLRRWRPWVVIAAGGPQQRLLDNGYALAHDDGMQHYYAAVEQPAVLAALRLPPHPADDFQLCEDHPYSHPLAEWRQRTATAEAASQESRTWAMAHVEEWKQKDYLSTENKLRAERASAALELMTARALAAESQLGPLRERTSHAEGTLGAVYASLSWRVTLPLRTGKLYAGKAVRLARRVAGRVKRGAVGAVKRVLRYAVHFVTSRPRLSFLVRRAAARFPLLVRVLRRIAMQTQAQAADAAQAPASAELQQLPAAARQVYDDLRRSRQAVPRR